MIQFNCNFITVIIKINIYEMLLLEGYNTSSVYYAMTKLTQTVKINYSNFFTYFFLYILFCAS